MSNYENNIIKVCTTVHELKGTCERLRSEVDWLRETVASLMMKMTYPQHTLPLMTMQDWQKMNERGPTCRSVEKVEEPRKVTGDV